MKLRIILASLVCAAPLFAQNTPNIGLHVPALNSTGWGVSINYNFTLLDNLLGGSTRYPTGVFQQSTDPAGSCFASYLIVSTATLAAPTVWSCSGGNWVKVSGAGGGGSSAWSAATNPTTNLALSMGAYGTTYLYNSATGSGDLNLWTDTAGNNGTGILGHFSTAAGSTVTPWQADANGCGWKIDPATGDLVSVGSCASAASSMGFVGSTSGNTVTLGAAPTTSNFNYNFPASPALTGQYQTTDSTGQAIYKSPDFAITLGTLSLTGTGSTSFVYTPMAPVSLTRLEWSVGTQAVGCTTSPQLQAQTLSGGTSWLNATVGNGASTGYVSGPTTVPVAANTSVIVSTVIAAAGCSTPPGVASITLHYSMQ